MWISRDKFESMQFDITNLSKLLFEARGALCKPAEVKKYPPLQNIAVTLDSGIVHKLVANKVISGDVYHNGYEYVSNENTTSFGIESADGFLDVAKFKGIPISIIYSEIKK